MAPRYCVIFGSPSIGCLITVLPFCMGFVYLINLGNEGYIKYAQI